LNQPVGVVLTHHTGKGDLVQCLQSVEKQITSFSFHVMLVIMDNGDPDLLQKLPPLNLSFQLDVLAAEEDSTAESRLVSAFNQLKSPFVVADDTMSVWKPQKLQMQYDYMMSSPDSLSCGHLIKLKSGESVNWNLTGTFDTTSMIGQKGFPITSFMYRKESLPSFALWHPLMTVHSLIISHLISFKQPVYLLPEELSTRTEIAKSKKTHEELQKWLSVRIMVMKRLNVESKLVFDRHYDKVIRAFHRSLFMLKIRYQNKWSKEDYAEGIKKLSGMQKFRFLIKVLWNWTIT
jgi:hypothetical protein